MTTQSEVVIAEGVEVEVIPTPQDELRFTQNIRKNIAMNIYNRRSKANPADPMSHGWDDKTENSMLVSMLDGMDRQNIQVARLKVEEQAAKNGEEMTRMVGELLTQAKRGQTELPPIIEGSRQIPQLPDDVLLPSLSEEEASRTTKPDNYADFMSRTNQ